MNGCGEFLAGHHEAAVTGKTDHLTIAVQSRGGDRGRQAVAHGATGGRQFGPIVAVGVEAMEPDSVVAGAVAENGVIVQGGIKILDDGMQLDLTGRVLSLAEGFEIGSRFAQPVRVDSARH